jgi:hypothetical protein
MERPNKERREKQNCAVASTVIQFWPLFVFMKTCQRRSGGRDLLTLPAMTVRFAVGTASEHVICFKEIVLVCKHELVTRSRDGLGVVIYRSWYWKITCVAFLFSLVTCIKRVWSFLNKIWLNVHITWHTSVLFAWFMVVRLELRTIIYATIKLDRGVRLIWTSH